VARRAPPIEVPANNHARGNRTRLVLYPDQPVIFRASIVVVVRELIGYIAGMVSKAQKIILADHARLPWRFFGRLTVVQAGL
jgi:hypothetical protein